MSDATFYVLAHPQRYDDLRRWLSPERYALDQAVKRGAALAYRKWWSVSHAE